MSEEKVFPMNTWFETIFGFEEFSFFVKERIEVIEFSDHVELKSKINKKVYNAGNFQIKSSARGSYKLPKKDKQGSLNIIKGYGRQSKHFELVDILAIQSLPKWNGATYLVASNFNCLEFTSPYENASVGVNEYYEDVTQGPYAALACCPAVVYRNYFIKHQDEIGQLNIEINLLDKTPINVKHGYAMINNDEDFKEKITEFNWDDPNIWQIGIHSNCEVVLNRGNTESTFSIAPRNQIANHIYASAFSFYDYVKYTDLTVSIAKKLLIAEYRAAILATWENSINFSNLAGSNKLLLTLLGGGVFNNPYNIICEAINENVELIKESGLEVYISCFGEDDFIEIEQFIMKDVHITNGKVIDTNNDQNCRDLI